MKALSLRQPWAWLVVHGGKRIENRRWNTNYRGPFLIHAAKGMTVADYDDAWSFVRGIVKDWSLSQRMPNRESLARGGIVGRASIVDALTPCAPPEYVGGACSCVGGSWHMGNQFGFVLEDVEPLPFFPWNGSLGFFNIPDAKLPELYRGCGPIGETQAARGH